MTTADPTILLAHIEALTEHGPRNLGAPGNGHANAIAYVATVLEGLGWNVELQPFEFGPTVGLDDGASPHNPFPLKFFPELRGINIVATPPGVHGPWTVLSAHYDTVLRSAGADDNGSGVAAVLETARLLRGTHQPVALVLFDREETGKQGALAYARRHRGQVSSVVNLEMIGLYSDDEGSNPLPWIAQKTFRNAASTMRERGFRRNGLVIVSDRRSGAVAAAVTDAAAGQLPTIDVVDPRPAGRIRSLFTLALIATSLLDRSDHARFWDQGVPAVMVLSGTPNGSKHYHAASDTAETLDYDRLAAATDVAAAAVARLAAVPAV